MHAGAQLVLVGVCDTRDTARSRTLSRVPMQSFIFSRDLGLNFPYPDVSGRFAPKPWCDLELSSLKSNKLRYLEKPRVTRVGVNDS